MDDVYKMKRDIKAKKLVNDFISFFENEYGIRHDAEGDLSLGEKAEEQLPWARGWSVVRHQNAVNGNVYKLPV